MLKTIIKMTQHALKKYCYSNLVVKYGKKSVVNTQDFVYAKGDIPVLLVAHLDTVHRQMPRLIVHDQEQNILWSPEGIGGDDRCGIYAILKIIETHKPHVLFTTDEETGAWGAKAATDYLPKPEVNFMIELDRRGEDEAVFYDCGNLDFQDFILSFDFFRGFGTFSDICELSPVWDLASANLSIGYYKEHTTSEHIKLNETHATIEKVKKILDNCGNVSYNYQEMRYYYNQWKKTNTCEICGFKEETFTFGGVEVCVDCIDEYFEYDPKEEDGGKPF